MSVCGHCGLALEEGATACGSCGTAIAPARVAGERIKWGTLQISRVRPGSGAFPTAEAPQLTAASTGFEPVSSLELSDCVGGRDTVAVRPVSAHVVLPLAVDADAEAISKRRHTHGDGDA